MVQNGKVVAVCFMKASRGSRGTAPQLDEGDFTLWLLYFRGRNPGIPE
jgi:hypothetical protein